MGLMHRIWQLVVHRDSPPPSVRRSRPTPPQHPSDLLVVSNVILDGLTRFFHSHHVWDAVDAQEAMAFAMAVVTEIYTLSQGTASKAAPALDAFHDAVDVLMQQRLLDPQRGTLNERGVAKVMTEFFDLLRRRYPEYQKVLRRDLLRKDPLWFGASKAVISNLLKDQLPDEEQQTLVVPFALHLSTAMLFAADALWPAHASPPDPV